MVREVENKFSLRRALLVWREHVAMAFRVNQVLDVFLDTRKGQLKNEIFVYL
jgi:hypothetical protein